MNTSVLNTEIADTTIYVASNEVLDITQLEIRDDGANNDIIFATGKCSLGSILVAKSEMGICAILIGEDPAVLERDLKDRFSRANLINDQSVCRDIVAKITDLIENPALRLDLPLDIRGTVFQQRVWKALQQIPAGSTASYVDIARKIGMPKAFRAVARACGANSLAVAIPCHRVVRSDGAISGYRWGVERKRTLLNREAHA